MSVIVYGPQGCGKTKNAEALRTLFKCDRVIDDGKNPYPKSNKQDEKFKAGNDLFLTCEEPPARCLGAERRIMSYENAMRLTTGAVVNV